MSIKQRIHVNLTIGTKIGILVASAMAVLLIVQVFFVIPQIHERELDLQKAIYEAKVIPVANEVEEFQNDMLYKIEMLTRMPEIKSMNARQQELILSISMRSSWRFDTVAMGIADDDGTITIFQSLDPLLLSAQELSAGSDISETDFYKYCMARGATYFGSPYVDSVTGLPMLTIAAPIRSDKGALAGVIFANASLEAMITMIEQSDLNNDESIYLLDKNGIAVAHAGAGTDDMSAGFQGTDYSGYPVVKKLSDGKSGTGMFDMDGETYFASYMGIGTSGWGIVVQEPEHVFLSRTNALPNFLIGINAVIFIVALFAAMLLSRRITRPLVNLAGYARDVEKGDYSTVIDAKGRDEIAEVTHAIQSMVKQMVTAQEKEVTALTDSMNDGVLVVDKERKLIRMNRALEQMLDIKADEVLGKNPGQLREDPRYLPLARLIQAELPHEEVVLVYPVNRVLKVRSSKLMGKNDEAIGDVRVIIDVTHERELDQMKSDFISNTSHELRTPLHTIRGFIKLLQDDKVPDRETQKEFLGIVYEESKHLNSLVDSILNIAAIESGEMAFDKQPVSMNDVIKNVVYKMKSIADDKNISINVELSDAVPVIDGDSQKLGQVMRNLISNAIKFSDSGARVTVTSQPAGNEGVLVKVIDRGIGISEDDVLKLFQKFSQVDSSMTRNHGGTGLGLYITKQIVEAHDGNIRVESELGKGSTFSFVVRGLQSERKQKKRVGDMLIDEGLITKDQLRNVLRKQESQSF
jgi:two-component system phosphate regulon sensor histidine kinase PhoR